MGLVELPALVGVQGLEVLGQILPCPRWAAIRAAGADHRDARPGLALVVPGLSSAQQCLAMLGPDGLCRAQLVEYDEELVDPLAGNVSQVHGKTFPVFGGWYLSWRQG